MKNLDRDFYAPPRFMIETIVKQALEEDFGHGFDITSQTVIPKDCKATVQMIAREALPLAGIDCALSALKLIDSSLTIKQNAIDGQWLSKGESILDISGSARSIMMAERVALNFVGHLSGISLKTSEFVKAVEGTKAKIVCTRKTLPNLRFLQKYAVRLGGGYSHRYGIDDCVLIKDNHIAVCGGVKQAVEQAKRSIGHTTKIELECDTLAQVSEAIEASVDIIMLDNMNNDALRQAVSMIGNKARIEASGGVKLETVRGIAETGVDMISIGALTHSARYADIAFDFKELD